MSTIHKALQKTQLTPIKQKSAYRIQWVDIFLILIISILSVATIFFYYPRILKQPVQGAPVAITTNTIKIPSTTKPTAYTAAVTPLHAPHQVFV